MEKYLATIWGSVSAPPGVSRWGTDLTGVQKFLSSIIKTLIVVAGIYALFNLVLAGYDFMSAGGNSEKIAHAWAKIWQTLLGLVVAAGAFVLAAVFGQIVFGNPNALLQIVIYTP